MYIVIESACGLNSDTELPDDISSSSSIVVTEYSDFSIGASCLVQVNNCYKCFNTQVQNTLYAHSDKAF